MKKINFNDRYGLTQAVIEGRKTMTRRLISGFPLLKADHIEEAHYFAGYIQVTANGGESLMEVKSRYKVGEVVAVAQSYKNAGLDPTQYIANGDGYQLIGKHRGWRNKMYVKAELMPHRIRITGVRCERLQDISDEDCLKEGINASNSHEIGYGIPWVYEFAGSKMVYYTPREAFAALIDKVSDRGTWGLNPWVVVYEFELVK